MLILQYKRDKRQRKLYTREANELNEEKRDHVNWADTALQTDPNKRFTKDVIIALLGNRLTHINQILYFFL